MADYKIKKLTDCKWLNLFKVSYSRKNTADHKWMVCSRKEKPIIDAENPDAVYIVAIIKTQQGNRLVVTREFRVPIWDYEYGFPAGLIEDGEDIENTVARELKEETGLELVRITEVSKPVYSSAGMTDESCLMVFAEVAGTVSDEHLEGTEDIETYLFDLDDINNMLASGDKISSKAWGVFYHYSKLGRIEL